MITKNVKSCIASLKHSIYLICLPFHKNLMYIHSWCSIIDRVYVECYHHAAYSTFIATRTLDAKS